MRRFRELFTTGAIARQGNIARETVIQRLRRLGLESARDTTGRRLLTAAQVKMVLSASARTARAGGRRP